MKTKKTSVVLVLVTVIPLFFQAISTAAQCQSGKLEVKLKIKTDAYGNDGYWEIVPSGNTCGNGTIASGGNTKVGCNGGGKRLNPSGGYASNTLISEGPFCLDSLASYDLIYVDDYGDGGFKFTIEIEGYPMYKFEGKEATSTFQFKNRLPLQLDLGLYKISNYGYLKKGDVEIAGMVFNYGQDTIKAIELAYSIDGGSPVAKPIVDLLIVPFTSYHFTHPDKWVAEAIGDHKVKLWLNSVNGQMDLNSSNDTLLKTITIGEPIPNIIDSYINRVPVLKVIANSSKGIGTPTDLDFHPNLSKKELWVINRETEQSGGSTVKISNAGESNQTSLKQKDGNAYHFMSMPSGIAFSDNENFATSPSVFDANHDGGSPFTGPALWSSDPSIYAQPSGGNGSHLDMLHESPNSMGITHEKDNVFWVYDGYSRDIVKYDFREDHGPGNDDHSDGIIWRYPEIELQPIDFKIPNHLVLDKKSNWLYVVDNGNKRIVRLDITSGAKGGTPGFAPREVLEEYTNVTGVIWEDIITSGLEQPSGIAQIEDRLIVGDYSNGDIVLYDLSLAPQVKELYRIKTNKPGLTGITIGPDGHIWYTNFTAKEVIKVEVGQPVGVEYLTSSETGLQVFPNPATNFIKINHAFGSELDFQLMDVTGHEVMKGRLVNGKIVDVSDLAAGIYYLAATGKDQKSVQKFALIR